MIRYGQGKIHNTRVIQRDNGFRHQDYLATAIVSTYKAERFMKGRLDNLLAQTLGDRLEILVIDSASPEGEGDIVAEFQNHARNIRYLRTDRRETVYQAWNRAIAQATGQFLTNANTDDRLKNNALQQLISSLEQQPAAGIAFADFHITSCENDVFCHNHTGETTCRPPYSMNALLENCITGSQPVWRQNLHNTVGLFDITYASAGDYDFFIRSAQQCCCIHHKEPLGLVFISPTTFSGKGHLPCIEFYDIRERYHHLLTPTKATQDLSDNESSLLTLYKNKQLSIAADLFDITSSKSPRFIHEVGLLFEQHGMWEKAWKYLQKSYYLCPETTKYRNAHERLLTINLLSTMMELMQSSGEPSTCDKFQTVGIISRMLGCPATAAWLYFQALKSEPDNTINLVNLKRTLSMLQGDDI